MNAKNSSLFAATTLTLGILCRLKGAGEGQDDATIFFPRPRSEEQGGGFELLALSNDCHGKWCNFPAGTKVTLCGHFARTDTYLLAVEVPGEAPKGLVAREMSWKNLVDASNGGTEKQRERASKRAGTKDGAETATLRAKIAELEAKLKGIPAPEASPINVESVSETASEPEEVVLAPSDVQEVPEEVVHQEAKSVEDLLAE